MCDRERVGGEIGREIWGREGERLAYIQMDNRHVGRGAYV